MAVLDRYDNRTKAFRVCRDNFKNMPDFVWSQGGRTGNAGGSTSLEVEVETNRI